MSTLKIRLLAEIDGRFFIIHVGFCFHQKDVSESKNFPGPGRGRVFVAFLGDVSRSKESKATETADRKPYMCGKKTTKTKKKNGWKWPKTSKTVLNGQPFSPLRLTAKSRVVSGQIHQPRLPRWIVGVTRWGGRLNDVWKVVNASWQ